MGAFLHLGSWIRESSRIVQIAQKTVNRILEFCPISNAKDRLKNEKAQELESICSVTC